MDATSGTLKTIDEARSRELRRLHADLGPLVLEALSDPHTVEVLLNADGTLWQERLGEPLREIGAMGAWQAESLLRAVAAWLNVVVTRESPLIEGELPDGSRFAGQMPPVVSAPCFAIRKRASSVYTLGQYVDAGIMTLAQADLIRQAVKGRRNVVITGGVGTGKSTLVNAVLADISRQYPDERILVLEDTVELQVSSRNVVAYRTSETVDMRRLIRMTLRMRPDRIIVGEVRGPEALDLLVAWNLGHEGGISTLHANHAKAALSRLRLLVSMHPDAPDPIEPLIAEARPLLIHLTRAPGGRVLREVISVEGYGPDGYHFDSL
jgi:type IV secretion system protein VirB11